VDEVEFDDSTVRLKVIALKALRSLLMETGKLLNKKVRTQIDTAILSLTISMCNSEVSSSESQYQGIYKNSSFRYHIYKVLFASASSSVSTQAPILPYAIRFFTIGAIDPTRKISKFCHEGLLIFSEYIHPKIPPLLSRDTLRDPENYTSHLNSQNILTTSETDIGEDFKRKKKERISTRKH